MPPWWHPSDRAAKGGAHGSADGTRSVHVTLHVHGRAPVASLTAALAEFEGVRAVAVDDANVIRE